MLKEMEKYHLSNSHWLELINEWVHSERDRYILKRKLIDKHTFEDIAEEVGMSDRQIKTIVTKNFAEIITHIP